MLIYLFIGGIIFIILILTYNGLINKSNQVENAFGGMEAQLKKRYDLIPNLISAVKTYMKHEKDVLTQITELRERTTKKELSNDEKVKLDNVMTAHLSGIVLAVENYPDLKASENFMQLQRNLNEAEEQISAARRAYNAAVVSYNNGVEMFPSNIFAKAMKMTQKEVFTIPVQQRENVNTQEKFNT